MSSAIDLTPRKCLFELKLKTCQDQLCHKLPTVVAPRVRRRGGTTWGGVSASDGPVAAPADRGGLRSASGERRPTSVRPAAPDCRPESRAAAPSRHAWRAVESNGVRRRADRHRVRRPAANDATNWHVTSPARSERFWGYTRLLALPVCL